MGSSPTHDDPFRPRQTFTDSTSSMSGGRVGHDALEKKRIGTGKRLTVTGLIMSGGVGEEARAEAVLGRLEEATAEALEAGNKKVLEKAVKTEIRRERRLFEDGWVDLSVIVCGDTTLLHAAVRLGAEGAVDLLLEYGADPNTLDERGDTAVHALASRDASDRDLNSSLAELLMDAGGDLAVRSVTDGKTPLQRAPKALAAMLREWDVASSAGASSAVGDISDDSSYSGSPSPSQSQSQSSQSGSGGGDQGEGGAAKPPPLKRQGSLGRALSVSAPASRADVRRLFLELDADRNGGIGFDDIRAVLEGAGIEAADEDVRRMVAMGDDEGEGEVMFAYFSGVVDKCRQYRQRELERRRERDGGEQRPPRRHAKG